MKLFWNIALASALSAVVTTPANAAFNDAGTDYTDQKVGSYIESGPAGEALAMVDFLLCIIDKSKAITNPNLTYSVLTDEIACNGEVNQSPEYGTQTLTTSGNENPTANDPYVMDTWFVTKEGIHALAKLSVTSWATDDLPNGVFTMDWKMVFPEAMVGNKGSLSFNADGRMSYLENSVQGGNILTYVEGRLSAPTASASVGSLHIKALTFDSSDDPVTSLYRYAFDESHLKYDKDSSAAVCYDRSESNETTRVFGYQLFDSAGGKVPHSGPFQFTYVNSAGGNQAGYVAPWGTWLQGGEDNLSKPSVIKRNSNDKDYGICYDDDQETDSGSRYDNGKDDNIAGNSTVCGTEGDEIAVGLIDLSTNIPYPWAPTIAFDEVTFVDSISGNSADKFLFYDGEGSSLGLPWECLLSDDTWSNNRSGLCTGAREWRPEFQVPDGTLLTRDDADGNPITYYLKAIDTRRYLKKESNVTPCADISLDSVLPRSPPFTLSDIVDVDLLWDDLPSVTEANTLKYIHGVAQ